MDPIDETRRVNIELSYRFEPQIVDRKDAWTPQSCHRDRSLDEPWGKRKQKLGIGRLTSQTGVLRESAIQIQ
jgi:hypothetical protein